MSNDARSILLVDDDAFLLDLYARKFSQAGFAVTKAGNAEEALEQLRRGLAPRAIAFDIVMPRMDGYEFLRTLNEEGLGKGAVRVALSNETKEEDVAKVHALGAEFISKASAIPSEAVNAIERLIDSAASAQNHG